MLPDTEPKPIFGGKSYQALPWHPLPFMEQYLRELASGETPHSEDYIRPVKVGLSHFATFAAGEGVRHPNELTREHILRFQAYLATIETQRGKLLSLSYRQQLTKYVRTWINWMDELDYIDQSPWFKIKVGRVPKKPKPLEDDEVDQLFDAHRAQAFAIPPFAFHRREVILVLLAGWGLRIHELQSLNVAQMPVTVASVTVRNKGGGQKTLPYSRPIKDSVSRWLPQRARYAVYGEDALIIDNSGKRLSIPRIRQIIVELGERASVPINPHRFRDTLGTTLLDHDVPIERIMKLLGHTQRAQTLAYSRVNDPKVAESHDAVISPRLERLVNGTNQVRRTS